MANCGPPTNRATPTALLALPFPECIYRNDGTAENSPSQTLHLLAVSMAKVDPVYSKVAVLCIAFPL